jgi:putative intracellular protease/amidase
MKKAYVLIFEGYADWELGNVLSELRRLGKIEVVSVGFTQNNVLSMGGLKVIPDIIISQVPLEDVLIFIIPGGYLWEEENPSDELKTFLNQLVESEIPVAAICAGTTVLGKANILQGKRHTSNSQKYLTKMVPDYKDSANYIDKLSTRDRHVITASGLGSVEFTREILEELNIASPEIRKIWFDAFKHGQYPENT